MFARPSIARATTSARARASLASRRVVERALAPPRTSSSRATSSVGDAPPTVVRVLARRGGQTRRRSGSRARSPRGRPFATPTERSEAGVDVEVLDPASDAARPRAADVAGSGPIARADDDAPPAGGLSIAGVPVTPEVAAIVLVYFVQGILGLSRLAKDFFVKDELGLDPAQASLIFSASSVPWLVKPLWGFISDSIPLFGYRRKSYLALCGGIGALAGVSLWGVVDDVPGAAAAFTLGSLSTAFADVVIDSVVVAIARGESQALSGSLQSLCWGSVAIGGIASAYFSGSLIEEYGTRYVFGVTALFPLLIAGAALLVDEAKIESDAARRTDEAGRDRDVARADTEMGTRVETSTALASAADERLSVGAQLAELGKKLWSVGKQRSIWAPTAFVFLWQATPNPGTAMFYFTTNELGFTPEFLGRVALARSAAALFGVGLYNTTLKRVPLKKMFLWSAVLGTALGLTQLILVSGYNRELGISDQFFSLGDTVVLTVLGEVSFLPVLVLAAKVCPEGVEATLFAALMSVFNAGGVASGALGAALTSALGVTSENFDNLFELVLLCNLSSLVPLLGLGWLDEAEGDDSEGDDSEEK